MSIPTSNLNRPHRYRPCRYRPCRYRCHQLSINLESVTFAASSHICSIRSRLRHRVTSAASESVYCITKTPLYTLSACLRQAAHFKILTDKRSVLFGGGELLRLRKCASWWGGGFGATEVRKSTEVRESRKCVEHHCSSLTEQHKSVLF